MDKKKVVVYIFLGWCGMTKGLETEGEEVEGFGSWEWRIPGVGALSPCTDFITRQY